MILWVIDENWLPIYFSWNEYSSCNFFFIPTLEETLQYNRTDTSKLKIDPTNYCLPQSCIFVPETKKKVIVILSNVRVLNSSLNYGHKFQNPSAGYIFIFLIFF